jgi:hypothetical protein
MSRFTRSICKLPMVNEIGLYSVVMRGSAPGVSS